jgi:sulfur carrier protein
MQVKINGKSEEIPPATLADLLQTRGIEPRMVTVELNGAMIERVQLDQTPIQAGDEVEFLYFMGGGTR